MLKGIPNVLPPDLLKILMEMGHGDELIIADSNFPAASHAQRLVRCDGLPRRNCLMPSCNFSPSTGLLNIPWH